MATLLINIQQTKMVREGAIGVEWRRGRYITPTKSTAHLMENDDG